MFQVLRIAARLLLFLDGYSAFADVDFDTGRFLTFLIELVANDTGDDGQRDDGDIQHIAVHDCVSPSLNVTENLVP